LLLLNGVGIHNRIKQDVEFGSRRDRLLRMTLPLRRVSEWTRAAVLRAGVQRTLGVWLNGDAAMDSPES